MNLKKSALIFFLLLFFLVPKLGYLNEPMMDWDEGIYETAALYINNGYLPYKDFFDHKPPLIYYFFATCDFVYHSFISFRIAYFIIFFLSELFLYLILRFFLDEFLSLLSVFLFSVSTSSFWASSLNGEQIFLLPVLISIYFFLRGNIKGKSWSFFVSGIFAALVFFIKYNGLLILFPLLLLEFKKEKIWKFLSGFLIVSIFILGFMLSKSIFSNFIYDTIIFNKKYMVAISYKIFKEFGIYSLWNVFKSSFFVIIPGLFIFFIKDDSFFVKLIKWLIIFSLFSAILPLKFLKHYFYPTLCFFSIATVIFFKNVNILRFKKLFLTILIVLFTFISFPSLKRFSEFSYEKINRFYVPIVISNFIKENSSKKDRIFLWRSHFLNTYYLCNRLPFTKYFFWCIFLRKPLPEEFVRGFKNDFEKCAPKYIVVGKSNIYSNRKFLFIEKILLKKYRKVFSYKSESVYKLLED